MSDIALTLSSPGVTLVDGKATLAISVTNSATTPQRIVLGAFADGAATQGPSFTKIDRSLRTVAAGSTEQYIASFDTGTAPSPGDYGVKFIAYSADGAPEDYADQGQVVTLTVPAAAVALPAKKFPWWIVAVGAVVVIALIAGVIYFVTKKPDAVTVAWAPDGPAAATAGSNAYYEHLRSSDCAQLKTDATKAAAAKDATAPVWAAVADTCAAMKSNSAADWKIATTSVAAVTPPKHDSTTCLDLAAFKTVDRVIAAHKAQPSAEIRAGHPISGLACTQQLVSIKPATAVPNSVTKVALAGYFVGDVSVQLELAGQAPIEVTATRDAEGSYSFTTPPLTAGDWNVTTSNTDGPLGARVTFSVRAPVDCSVFPRPLFCYRIDTLNQKFELFQHVGA